MIKEYKGKLIGNSISVFMFYKKVTGRSLERDILVMQKNQKVLENPEAYSDAEIDKAYAISPTEIMMNIYYAMRCAGESKSLEYLETIEEIEVDDLEGEDLIAMIQSLLTAKKKVKK